MNAMEEDCAFIISSNPREKVFDLFVLSNMRKLIDKVCSCAFHEKASFCVKVKFFL